MHRFVESARDATSASGAYALLIALDEPLWVRAGARGATLVPGLYVYCGSAMGSGGIAARLARHMRRYKRSHWHVDQLTEAGKVVGAWVFPGRGECEVNGELADWPTPIEGFGSTDCQRCRAHLRFWARGALPPPKWGVPPHCGDA
jgi:Uri superfamily endonuclease